MLERCQTHGIEVLILKDEIWKQKVSVQHIKIDMMIADPLTKGLQPKAFKGHVQRMGLGCKDD